MLALADLAAVLAACFVVGSAFGHRLETALWIAATLPGWMLLAKLVGLYDRDHRALRHLTVDELPAILVWGLAGSSATALTFPEFGLPAIELRGAAELWLLVSLGAFAFRSFARFSWRALTPPDRAIIVGNGAAAAASRRKLELFPDIHVEVVGERHALGNGDLSRDHGWSTGIDRIIVAATSFDEEKISELVAYCRGHQIKLSVVPSERCLFGEAGYLNRVADLPLVEYSTWNVPRSTRLLKRVLDMVLALILFVLLAPLIVVIALAIRLDSPGPIFFTQQRAGLQARPFRMRKFCTMVADAEGRLSEVVALDDLQDPMFKLAKDPRVTRVGRILRRTSLDELPQLLNVLKGDMSLVGPRPEQIELVERYRPEHLFRLAVKPGLTGPMQVFGRGQLTFGERLAVEREYIDNLSLGRDLRILFLTIGAVARGNGAY